MIVCRGVNAKLHRQNSHCFSCLTYFCDMLTQSKLYVTCVFPSYNLFRTETVRIFFKEVGGQIVFAFQEVAEISSFSDICSSDEPKYGVP